MTLVSSIITDAYRETNLVPLVGTPTAAEQAEGLRRFNTIILALMGNEVGDHLSDIPIGGEHDQSEFVTTEVPANARLVLNQAAAAEYKLAAYPYDGQRVGITDIAGNLATYNLTLNGNGRQIEGAATLALSTNGLDRQWMYRADTGNWVRITELATTDEMPFPVEFDDYFITRLAMRLNPRHSAATAQETASIMQDGESRLMARYRVPRPKQDVGSLGLMGQQFGGTEGGALTFGRYV